MSYRSAIEGSNEGSPPSVARRRRSTPWIGPLAALTIIVGGCRLPDPPTITPAVPTVDPQARATAAPDARAFTMKVSTSVIGPGFDRFAFIVTDDQGAAVEDATVETIFYSQTAAGPHRNASGPALYFGRGLPGGGRWVSYTDFDISGPWSIDVSVKMLDGTQGTASADFEVAGRTALLAANQVPPDGDTPTASADALAAVTSDPNPLAALYAQSFNEAAKTKKPIVVHFSSPGRCTDPVCRDAIVPVKSALADWANDVVFIHVESRDAADPGQLSATAKAWGLSSDPWTFVFSRRGRLYARVDGAVSAEELGLMINQAGKAP